MKIRMFDALLHGERNAAGLDGRFLLVRGDLHEYRIHIGSGNVLMELGSRYLCIVQGAGDSRSAV
jgi:hypothetical protein